MSLAQELTARGFIHQYTAEKLEDITDGEKRTIYHGVDPSADSIHAGNFVNWVFLRHLSEAGHKIVLLVGGGTGMIGDPKPDDERTLIAQHEVERRVAKLQAQAEQLLGGIEIEVVNNYDWLGQLKLIEFLRDIGKHFTVNELIKKDAIATRLSSEVGLSYTEFAYPLLQGYDYLTLYREKGCTLQIGGSDQWGNMVAGVDLIRRLEKAEVHVLTTPLVIDKTTGKKFGKSEGNAVWLDPEKTSPYQFYQFWLNTTDDNVADYIKRFTFIPLPEIEAVLSDHGMDPGRRVAQRRLAAEVTRLVHGDETTTAVEHVSAILFGEGTLSDLDETGRALLLQNAPIHTVTVGRTLVDILVESGMASSKREARTFIESGAISLGGNKITTTETVVAENDFIAGLALLQRGRKHVRVLTL